MSERDPEHFLPPPSTSTRPMPPTHIETNLLRGLEAEHVALHQLRSKVLEAKAEYEFENDVLERTKHKLILMREKITAPEKSSDGIEAKQIQATKHHVT